MTAAAFAMGAMACGGSSGGGGGAGGVSSSATGSAGGSTTVSTSGTSGSTTSSTTGSTSSSVGGSGTTTGSTTSGSGGAGGTGTTSTSSTTSSTSSTTTGGGAVDLPGFACGSCPSGFTNKSGNCFPSNNPKYGCGSGTACTVPPSSHVEPACAGGLCALGACTAGFADCDAAPGCETDITTPEHCGACNNACAAGQVCTPAGCAPACSFPSTNCNGTCINTQNDPHHCGQCFHSCPVEPNGDALCTNGGCQIACRTGYTLKNGKCLDPSSDATCCGPTCQVCPNPPGGSSVCNGGSCQVLCPPGTALCGGKCAILASDAAHCGACNTPCSPGLCIGGACDPTATDVLATGVGKPSEILVDDDAVYYVNGNPSGSPNAVVRIDKATGASTTLVNVTLNHVALDDAYLYWNEIDAIRRVPKVGGAAQLVVPLTAPAADLTVRGGKVYWADTAAMTIFAMPSDGSASPVAVVVDVVPIVKIAVNTTNVYWIDQNGSQSFLWRTSIDGLGAHTQMDEVNPWVLAVDAENVYANPVSNPSSAPRMVVRNANQSLFGIGAEGQVAAIALDDTYLYVAGNDLSGPVAGKTQKCVTRMNLGDAPDYLSPPIQGPFAVDEGFIYHAVNGALRRTPK